MTLAFPIDFASRPDHPGRVLLSAAILPALDKTEGLMAKTKTKFKVKTKAQPAPAPRRTKKEMIFALLQRKDGATIDELADAVGWATDSVRGFLSVEQSKGGINIGSEKDELEPRRYFIAARRRTR